MERSNRDNQSHVFVLVTSHETISALLARDYYMQIYFMKLTPEYFVNLANHHILRQTINDLFILLFARSQLRTDYTLTSSLHPQCVQHMLNEHICYHLWGDTFYNNCYMDGNFVPTNCVQVTYICATHDDIIKWKHFPRHRQALCEGYLPVTGGFPSQRPAMRNFDVFFALCLNKRLRKQSRRRRRHRSDYDIIIMYTRSLLVQIMACSAPSHFLNQCWLVVNRTSRKKILWDSSQNTTIFSQENRFENLLRTIAAILSRLPRVYKDDACFLKRVNKGVQQG